MVLIPGRLDRVLRMLGEHGMIWQRFRRVGDGMLLPRRGAVSGFPAGCVPERGLVVRCGHVWRGSFHSLSFFSLRPVASIYASHIFFVWPVARVDHAVFSKCVHVAGWCGT